MFDIIQWFSDFFRNLAQAGTDFARISLQASGSLTAVSAAWGNVTYVGPIIMTLIGAIFAFIIIDFIRDIL